jgi:uncharacterized protein GlcG (DUF336 family)
MKLKGARKILALSVARRVNLKPPAVAVLDARGAFRDFAAENGTSLKRAEIATAKDAGALAMAMGSQAFGTMAAQRPRFLAAVTHVVGGILVLVARGVPIRGGAGELIGALGISDDASDNHQAAAVAGIDAAGLQAALGA